MNKAAISALCMLMLSSVCPDRCALAMPDEPQTATEPVRAAAEAGSGSIVAPLGADAQSVLMHALSLIGVNYRYGGNSVERGFDCSGFVRYVFAEAIAMELPRSSYGMSRLGKHISHHQLIPGDLLFYNTLRRQFSHVAIYLGEGRFVHAPSKGKQVEIVDMSDPYWKKRFNGARRLLAAE
jgi:cell wall-associated NlpC family hydrolase